MLDTSFFEVMVRTQKRNKMTVLFYNPQAGY